MRPFLLGGNVSISDLVSVACRNSPVALPVSARSRIGAARRVLEKAAASGQPVYGVNTGFGELASRRIPPEDVRVLQYNLLRSHACGVEEPLPDPEARAILFLRANELARGHSGCRAELVELLVRLLNRGVTPVVPSRGSVGASGDLAPQAHAALVVIGEGRAKLRGKNGLHGAVLSGKQALKRAGLKPLMLEAKEGLSLINGTQAMQSVGGLALSRAHAVFEAATLAGAMSLEAVKGTPTPFDSALARLKPHAGQLRVAERLRRLLEGSEIRESHRDGDLRVQDPYSFRCMPQVHGAVEDALDYARRTVETEMASVTDNPVIIGGRVISGGHFHGQSLSLALDAAAVAMTALGNISERRIAQLVSGVHELPPFLADNPGLESGFMIPQVAAAALASENKVLAHPASADSIPTSAEKEDFVSMGMTAALKFSCIVEHSARIVAIELLASARGVERRRPLRPGKGLRRPLAEVRRMAPVPRGDVSMSRPIEDLARGILDGGFCPADSGDARDGR